MTLSDALSTASAANTAWLNAAANYTSLVGEGSPQPQTSMALALANAALTTLKGTQGDVDTAYADL